MRLYNILYVRTGNTTKNRVRSEEILTRDQNLALGLVGGIITMFICAAAWAAATYQTGRQMVLMPILIGYLVGSSIRISGRGAAPAYAISGAVLAILSCLLGNLWGAVGLIVEEQPASFFEAVLWLNFFNSIEILIGIFQPVDLIFYIAAGYFGYRFSNLPVQRPA